MSGARSSVPAGDGRSFPIAGKEADLARLCQEVHVRTLELFGSAAANAFDPERSDLDFLVEFEPLPPADYATAFFALKHALEEFFGCSVDLVVSSAIRNPYFRQSVEQTKALLYAA